MKTEIVVLPEDVARIAENVSVEKRNEVQNVLNHVFNGVAKMREQLDSITVIDENDKVNMKLSNTIRLGVRQVRLDSERTFDGKRSEVQQQMLSYKTEDSLWLKAKQTMQILTKEIEENARWKEGTKQRFDDEKKELKTQNRITEVVKYNSEISRFEFENMSDEMFNVFLSGLEKSYTDRIEAEAKIERLRLAAVEAEKAEKAEKAEQKRIKEENERLKLAAEETERLAAIEAEKRIQAEKERLVKEAAELKIRQEKEQKERESHEKALQIEKMKAAKIAAELAVKVAAEIKDEKEHLEAVEREASKGDSVKVTDLINDLTLLKSKYTFKSEKNKKMYYQVGELLSKVINHIQ